MISFFTETLNACFVKFLEFDGKKGAKIEFNGTFINIRVPSEKEKINGSQNVIGFHHIAFQVEDCDQAYKDIKNEGFEFLETPKSTRNIRTAFFKGPEDIVIELIQIV